MNNRRPRPRNRPAYTLIELLFAIGITAIAGSVAVAMIVAVAGLADASAGTPQRVARVAEFGRLLRADAAAASEVSAEDGTLLLVGDAEVVYAAEGGVVSRTVDGRPPERFDFRGDVTLTATDGLVRVDVAPPPDAKATAVPYRFDAVLQNDGGTP